MDPPGHQGAVGLCGGTPGQHFKLLANGMNKGEGIPHRWQAQTTTNDSFQKNSIVHKSQGFPTVKLELKLPLW